ncbi:MAG: hypothetical protein LC795_14135 [Acidobacteria bacterium]|nr:hypothetical protein [Acidobacteriota bacterium]MCA1620418.1 hypothetical protein [Acidobacteriota bacterium]
MADARAHAVTLPASALSAFALLQSVPLPGLGTVSFDPYESRVFALRLAAVALYAAMLLRYAATGRRLRALAAAVVCVGAASALFGLFRQEAQREELGFFLPLLRHGEGFAQFVSRNHFPFLAEMALGLALGLGCQEWARGVTRAKALVWAAAAAAVVWVGLVASNSRGGLLAMLCQTLFLAATLWTAWGGTRRTGPFAHSGGREPFAARTKSLVTGGPPFVEVVAASKPGATLATTAPLPPATDGWRDFALEFDAPPAGAVRVALRREPCASPTCPAFGGVWLDAFELRRIG